MTEEERKKADAEFDKTIVKAVVGGVALVAVAAFGAGYEMGKQSVDEAKASNCVNGGQVIDNSVHINYNEQRSPDPD